MADQKRWWKMWGSILTDDAILSLPLEDRWRWVALGCYMTEHGDRGRLQISPYSSALSFIFGVPKEDVLNTLKRLPNVCVEEGQNHDANICVTFRNWHKYQIDSTAALRMKTLRLKRRGEERRGEESKKKVLTTTAHTLETALTDPGLVTAWKKAFSGVALGREADKMRSWIAANPTKGKKDWPRFINNWLARSADRQPKGAHGTFNPAAEAQLARERDQRVRGSALQGDAPSDAGRVDPARPQRPQGA